MRWSTRKYGFTALLLLAAVLPPAAQAIESGSERPKAILELTVHWFDPTGKLQAAWGPVTEQVGELFATASVSVHWTDSKDNMDESAIAIVLLPDPPRIPYLPAHTLGGVSDGERRRFAYVYFNPVLAACGLEHPVHALSTDDEVIFWRALSRVISHEIVHSLVPGGRHASSGIMSPSLSPSMLLRSHLGFDEVTTCQIRHALGAQEPCETPPTRNAPR